MTHTKNPRDKSCRNNTQNALPLTHPRRWTIHKPWSTRAPNSMLFHLLKPPPQILRLALRLRVANKTLQCPLTVTIRSKRTHTQPRRLFHRHAVRYPRNERPALMPRNTRIPRQRELEPAPIMSQRSTPPPSTFWPVYTPSTRFLRNTLIS